MAKTIYKFGVANGVSAADTIIHTGHATVGIDPFPTSPGQLTFESDSIEDAPGGTGAEAIKIIGLRESSGRYTTGVFTIKTNGTNEVTVVGWENAFRCHRLSCAYGATNVGTIVVKIGGVVVNEIPASVGQSETATWTTASNEYSWIRRIHAEMLVGNGASPSAIIKCWRKPAGSAGPWRVFLPPMSLTEASPKDQHVFPEPGPAIESETDVMAKTFAVTGSNSDFLAGMDVKPVV